MTLSEMRRYLAERDIRLTRSLGQNFLHDSHQLDRIVAAAALGEGDLVLEIGPGLGPLTELLVGRCRRVMAVEKDQRLYEVLAERFAGQQTLELRQADALEIVREPDRDWRDWKLVANLPYSVASPILVELALHLAGPKRMTVTLQHEVALRLAAVPGTADYGVLTLLAQLRYEPILHFKIPPTCFFPPPEVESACISLVRRTADLLPEGWIKDFVRLVKRGFSQRRKMMLKLLKQDWPGPALERAYEVVGLSPQVRAERVSLDQFVEMTRLLTSGTKAQEKTEDQSVRRMEHE